MAVERRMNMLPEEDLLGVEDKTKRSTVLTFRYDSVTDDQRLIILVETAKAKGISKLRSDQLGQTTLTFRGDYDCDEVIDCLCELGLDFEGEAESEYSITSYRYIKGVLFSCNTMSHEDFKLLIGLK